MSVIRKEMILGEVRIPFVLMCLVLKGTVIRTSPQRTVLGWSSVVRNRIEETDEAERDKVLLERRGDR